MFFTPKEERPLNQWIRYIKKNAGETKNSCLKTILTLSRANEESSRTDLNHQNTTNKRIAIWNIESGSLLGSHTFQSARNIFWLFDDLYAIRFTRDGLRDCFT
mmetsp:Transcript_36844/g.77318  ORF Transcript_36844/g.77318 Transcript_36844/m.77318 type:complete len:103 (-) Transcript_36844:512-820(-)